MFRIASLLLLTVSAYSPEKTSTENSNLDADDTMLRLETDASGESSSSSLLETDANIAISMTRKKAKNGCIKSLIPPANGSTDWKFVCDSFSPSGGASEGWYF